jgi:hypothetical protein
VAYFDKSPGDTLTAANVDTLMLQSVMRFASEAARNAALSGVLAEGLVTYQDDTNTMTLYNGSAWVIVGEPVQSWTPTVTQSGAVTKTVTWGYYQRSNGLFTASCRLDFTGAGTATNKIIVTSPITHIVAGGSFMFYDTSNAFYRVGFVVPESTTEFSFAIDSGTDFYGKAAGDGITSGDVLWMTVNGNY